MRDCPGEKAGGIISLSVEAVNGETEYYGKKVKDLQENIRVSDDSISGTLNYVEGYKKFSGRAELQKGNFLALSFESEDAEKIETRVINGDSDKYVDLTADKYCVYRIKDAATQKIEVRVTRDGESMIRIYSLTNLVCRQCPVGETAFHSQTEKTDYGQFGNTETFYKDVNVSWTGTKAKVTGELNFVDSAKRAQFSKLSKDGNYFAFALKDWFNDKTITVESNKTNTGAFTDWVMFITEETKTKGMTVKYENTVIATFDLSEVTLSKSV